MIGKNDDSCPSGAPACAYQNTNSISLLWNKLHGTSDILAHVAHESGHIIDFQASKRFGYPDNKLYSEATFGAFGWQQNSDGSWTYTLPKVRNSGYVTPYAVDKGPYEDLAETFMYVVDHNPLLAVYSSNNMGQPVAFNRFYGYYMGAPSDTRLQALDVAIYK